MHDLVGSNFCRSFLASFSLHFPISGFFNSLLVTIYLTTASKIQLNIHMVKSSFGPVLSWFYFLFSYIDNSLVIIIIGLSQLMAIILGQHQEMLKFCTKRMTENESVFKNNTNLFQCIIYLFNMNSSFEVVSRYN